MSTLTTSRADARRAAAAPLLVLGTITAVSAIRGHRRLPMATGAAFTLVAILALLFPRTIASVSRAAARLGAAAGKAVSYVVAGLIAIVVVLPAWGINRLCRLGPLDDGWAGRSTTWRVRAQPVGGPAPST